MDIARLIDHTLLKPHASRADMEQLCREAVQFGFATVCVNGIWVRDCAALLKGNSVAVCAVAGFPLGGSATDVKCDEARRAIDDGAREIDFVINLGAVKSGDWAAMRADVAAVVQTCRNGGALSKVIIETCYLDDDEKAQACAHARAACADFVKTSTGFGSAGATAADVALMRRTVGPVMGVKAAGGIRDLATLEAMIAAGATRIGASASVRMVEEARQRGSESRPGRTPS